MSASTPVLLAALMFPSCSGKPTVFKSSESESVVQITRNRLGSLELIRCQAMLPELHAAIQGTAHELRHDPKGAFLQTEKLGEQLQRFGKKLVETRALAHAQRIPLLELNDLVDTFFSAAAVYQLGRSNLQEPRPVFLKTLTEVEVELITYDLQTKSSETPINNLLQSLFLMSIQSISLKYPKEFREAGETFINEKLLQLNAYGRSLVTTGAWKDLTVTWI